MPFELELEQKNYTFEQWADNFISNNKHIMEILKKPLNNIID
jgi:hypothetical protein